MMFWMETHPKKLTEWEERCHKDNGLKKLRSGHEGTSGSAGDFGPHANQGREKLKVLEEGTHMIAPVPGR